MEAVATRWSAKKCALRNVSRLNYLDLQEKELVKAVIFFGNADLLILMAKLHSYTKTWQFHGTHPTIYQPFFLKGVMNFQVLKN